MNPPMTTPEDDLARLRRELAAALMRYANLLAAARATLAAARDGEDDPLAYLADELAAHHPSRGGDRTWGGGR